MLSAVSERKTAAGGGDDPCQARGVKKGTGTPSGSLFNFHSASLGHKPGPERVLPANNGKIRLLSISKPASCFRLQRSGYASSGSPASSAAPPLPLVVCGERFVKHRGGVCRASRRLAFWLRSRNQVGLARIGWSELPLSRRKGGFVSKRRAAHPPSRSVPAAANRWSARVRGRAKRVADKVTITKVRRRMRRCVVFRTGWSGGVTGRSAVGGGGVRRT